MPRLVVPAVGCLMTGASPGRGGINPVAVWVGRMQPYHRGHFYALSKSLERLPWQHLVCFSCADPSSRRQDPREIFTPWERSQLFELIVDAHGLTDRVAWRFVPRLPVGEWAELDTYLPPGAVRCVLSSRSESRVRVSEWTRLGVPYEVIDDGGLDISSTMMRRAAGAGGSWKEYLHESQFDFFEAIAGPERMGFGA
jgi:nicotinamide mononucleotide adenylyltransferase